ncbi:hypothetical protein JCM9140_4702 [Halalkalibacter wakoensis JCM 9140]|uniref:Uncharacterized protein n=1 Tax=Halalkalibacter wakoensis JCM 9140 TaxID=1236970 RepID=W4QAS4_9BACI|nr:hypothetical protein JCM9140_4702 [Halalkalibacter wakoensis JCM 9140]
MHIILSLFVFYLNLRKNTYKNLPTFLPSILYVMFFNSVYYYFFKYFLLWEFKSSSIKVKPLRALYIFFVMPHVILLYLSGVPSRTKHYLVYLFKWVVLSSIIEALFKLTRTITFSHGWTLIWSFCIYLKMYLFSYLFLKKPVGTMKVTIASLICFLYVFNPPISKGFFEGPLLKLLMRFTPNKWRKGCVLKIGE